jgi:hypothetical protein
LYAGRKRRRKGEGLTTKDLVKRFLVAKKARVDAGELALGTFGDQYKTCKRVLSVFGGDRLVDDLARMTSRSYAPRSPRPMATRRGSLADARSGQRLSTRSKRR